MKENCKKLVLSIVYVYTEALGSLFLLGDTHNNKWPMRRDSGRKGTFLRFQVNLPKGKGFHERVEKSFI